MKLSFLAFFATAGFSGAAVVQDACPAMEGDGGDRRLLRRLGSSAVISNGVIKLGVNNLGSLNTGSSVPSISGTTTVGLRYIKEGTEYEATAQGCTCEGWGASANDGEGDITGWANSSSGNRNVKVVSFDSTSSTATAVTSISDKIKVTHEFGPSDKTANLYKVKVTYENIGAKTLTDLRYKRNMDWDADPTPFRECVSIITGDSAAFDFASDDGFGVSNALSETSGRMFTCPSSGCPVDCSAGNCDRGPSDHGAEFIFLFKEADGETPRSLAPGAKFDFSVYYGAADDKVNALGAISRVDAEAYSFGYSGADGCSAEATGGPVTFAFAFAGVGGSIVVPTIPTIPGVPSPDARGDPHFKTWSGEKYDFHGVCDLVLLQNAKLADGASLDIHIRTQKMQLWSFIHSAAVRIGNNVLEVEGGKNGSFFVNQEKGDFHQNIALGDYPVTFNYVNEKSREFIIDIGDGETINIKTWNGMVSVTINGHSAERFNNSIGLMGAYPSGERVARDGVTAIEDVNAFGLEWQVRSSDAKLFHNIDGPQHPEVCEMPSTSDMRRRLAGSIISLDDAKLACSRVASDNFDLCVFDVMATNDRDAAGAY